ncbi:protein kinase [Dactylosporangium sp. NPDC051541]|uniref:protein kinase domain-containing protein n=1 Tax=Dactylosporangium sp. NPDC051541 TaxID=3363977 RepID=UPI0037BA7A2E
MSRGGFTPAYASPEQTAGRPLSRRTDVWSLAVTVLEMFTGGVTWSSGAAAPYALEEYRRNGPPEPWLPPMPAPVADLLARCLRLDPAERPHTMAAVAAELLAFYEQTWGPYPYNADYPADLRAGELTNLALSQLDLGRPEAADLALTAALRADPHHPQAVYNSALLRWRRAEIRDDAAVAELADARAAAPDPDMDDLLAGIDRERGVVDGDGGARPRKPPRGVRLIRLAPGGRRAIGRRRWTPASTLVIWDVEDNRERWELPRRPSPVSAAAVTADGRRAVLGSTDGTVSVWHRDPGPAGPVLSGHTGPVLDVDVSADGRLALSGGADGTVRAVPSSDPGRARHGPGEGPPAAGRGRAGPMDERRDAEALGLLRQARGVRGHQRSGPVLDAWRRLADRSAVRTGLRTVWPAAPPTGADLTWPAGPGADRLGPDGRFAVSAGDGAEVRIWDRRAGACLRVLPTVARPVAVRFGAGGWSVLARTADGDVLAWELDWDLG